MKRFVVLFALSFAACDPTPTTDTGTSMPDVPSVVDGGGLDAGELDGGDDDAPALSDGGSSDGGISEVDAYCAGLIACVPGLTLENCRAGYQSELARAEGLGCGEEADDANACTAEAWVPGPDGGACAPALEPCDEVYTAYNHCIVEATGIERFSCDAGYVCITTDGSSSTPEAGCPSALGELVDACPDGEEVGRCVRDIYGDVTQTAVYYAPLPTGVTLESIEASCEAASSAGSPGVWSVP